MLKLAAAATTAATLALAATAQAQSIALAVPPDPVEEVAFPVTLTGVGLKDHFVYSTIKRAGGAGCGATFQTDADSVRVGQSGILPGGPFALTQTTSARNPGSYLVCAWLQSGSSAPAAAAATSAVVTVRSAQATLAVSGPKRITPGRTASFRFRGATELGRDVVATVKRGSRCGAAPTQDRGSRFLWANIGGVYSVKRAPTRFDLRFRGAYVLCAWVGESIPDPAPEAAASFRFRVETLRCARARAALAGARRTHDQRRVRQARSAVRRQCSR